MLPSGEGRFSRDAGLQSWGSGLLLMDVSLTQVLNRELGSRDVVEGGDTDSLYAGEIAPDS